MRIGDGNRFCTGCVVRAECVNNDNCIGIRSVVEPGVCINERVLLAANVTLPSPLASYNPHRPDAVASAAAAAAAEEEEEAAALDGRGEGGSSTFRRASSMGPIASSSSSSSRVRARECGSRGSADEPWEQVSLVPVCMVPGSASAVLRPTDLPPRMAEEDRFAPSLMDEEFENDLVEHRRLLREGHTPVAATAVGGAAR
jgi:hypothetical protein